MGPIELPEETNCVDRCPGPFRVIAGAGNSDLDEIARTIFERDQSTTLPIVE